jgi:hypothetical protein
MQSVEKFLSWFVGGALAVTLAPELVGAAMILVGIWALFELYKENEVVSEWRKKLRFFLLDRLGAAGAVNWSYVLVLDILLVLGVLSSTAIFPPLGLIVIPLGIWGIAKIWQHTSPESYEKYSQWAFKFITQVLGAGGATGSFLFLLQLGLCLALGATVVFPPLLIIILPVTVALWSGYLLYQDYQTTQKAEALPNITESTTTKVIVETDDQSITVPAPAPAPAHAVDSSMSGDRESSPSNPPSPSDQERLLSDSAVSGVALLVPSLHHDYETKDRKDGIPPVVSTAILTDGGFSSLTMGGF